jgi:hypothetical protein
MVIPFPGTLDELMTYSRSPVVVADFEERIKSTVAVDATVDTEFLFDKLEISVDVPKGVCEWHGVPMFDWWP